MSSCAVLDASKNLILTFDFCSAFELSFTGLLSLSMTIANPLSKVLSKLLAFNRLDNDFKSKYFSEKYFSILVLIYIHNFQTYLSHFPINYYP